MLLENDIRNFEVVLTINGLENKYSKRILQKYQKVCNILFVGQISRSAVFDLNKLPIV